MTWYVSMPATPDLDARVRDVLTWLEKRGTRANRDGMARYAIVAPKSFGVSVSDLRAFSKRVGQDHGLALALWKTGWYEARMLTSFVDEPERVTAAQMDRWAKDFDNWAICDALCFQLFDRTAHAWRKIDEWSGRREEFVKRAAFALAASVALHDKTAADDRFLPMLPLIERASTDERNFVKKGVSWALRAIGRRNASLNAAGVATAARLIASDSPSARWIGRDAHRELTSAAVQRQIARKAATGTTALRKQRAVKKR